MIPVWELRGAPYLYSYCGASYHTQQLKPSLSVYANFGYPVLDKLRSLFGPLGILKGLVHFFVLVDVQLVAIMQMHDGAAAKYWYTHPSE